MSSAVTLALVNANVLTMERTQPRAQAVAVAGERIAAVGGNGEILRFAQNDRVDARNDRVGRGGKVESGRVQVIDCQGLTLLPGFNDAHCHLPGLARRLQDLDCGPEYAPAIPALQALLRQRAESRPAGSWVRGFGYDDLRIAEGRHPNRWELDAAAPDCPIWLEHRSGHAAALNSRALELADIRLDTPDPPGGVIERDPYTGEPMGVLFEMRSFLRERLGNIRSPQEFKDGMRAAGRLLASYGITSAQDAGADNGIDRWHTFRRLQSTDVLPCRITMFAGAERLDELAAAGLSYGSGDNRLRLGHAKIMLTLTAGALHPSPVELKALVNGAHGRGFPVAIHCIEEEAIAAAARVLTSCPQAGLNDRIEHCAEGTPQLLAAVRQAGAAVVTNPGFLYHNGASYRENVAARLLPHLYPAGALRRAGVMVAFGSDAPVIDPNPWPAIYSSVTRRACDGRPLYGDGSAEQTVSVADALRMYTVAAAEVEGTAADKGFIAPGKLADMVLVDADPMAVEFGKLPEIRAVAAIVGGAVVWNEM